MYGYREQPRSDCGQPDSESGLDTARQALTITAAVRSARVLEHLARLRAAADAYSKNPAAKALVADINTLMAQHADGERR